MRFSKTTVLNMAHECKSFDLVQNDTLRFGLKSSAEFPSFRNVRLNLGTELEFKQFINLYKMAIISSKQFIFRSNEFKTI